MRLIVDVRMINASGIGVYLQNMLKRIIDVRQDWSFILLGNSIDLARFPWVNQPHVTVKAFHSPIYSIREHLWWLWNRPRGDALWVPHYNIPLFYNGEIIATVHDIAHLVLDSYRASFLKTLYARSLFQWVRNRTNGIIFVSNFTKLEFCQKVGTPKKLSWVITEGIDPSWRSPDLIRNAPAIESEGRGNKNDAPPYLVFVGNVKPHKNLRRLLSAFSSIKESIPHKLVLIGKKAGFITGDETIEKEAESLEERIVFTGYVSDEEVRKLVANADALVMPSIYEGFGLPVVEAMACGCPVLASSAASLPEVCGDAAIYFDPFNVSDIADKLLELLLSPEKRGLLRTKGLERSLHYDWDEAAQKTISAIEQAAAKS